MLLQYWDRDVRDLHAPRPEYDVRVTNKKTGKARTFRLREGMRLPVRRVEDYEIETLGLSKPKNLKPRKPRT